MNTNINFEFWAQNDAITLLEGSYLLDGYDPRGASEYTDREGNAFHPNDKLKLLTRALLSQTLGSIAGQQAESPPNLNTLIPMAAFIEWGCEKGFDPCIELQNTVAEQRYNPKLTPYMDAEHQYYSEELATSIRAWMGVFHISTPPATQSPKKSISDWVNSHSDDLSREAIERISTVANPDMAKKGGKPLTTEK